MVASGVMSSTLAPLVLPHYISPPSTFNVLLGSSASSYLDQLHAGRLDDWLIVLSRRAVEVFNLISVDGLIVLPSAIFSCGRLTVLRLYGCALPLLPAGFQGFPELRNLALINVRFQANGEYQQLEEIIATSPSLEKLLLWDVEIAGDFTEWVIQAPNLRDLNIRSAGDLGWNIGELPSLHSADIDIRDYLPDRDFAKFLAGFASVTKLVLCTLHSPVHANALNLAYLINIDNYAHFL
ncbi:hypothetical protein QYE76_002265 [Lolium multiflorum]|uniref:F-box/LRR-repeat protein 15/At3g58940/PEG3-like LRR domain-containing protein n=1 Tax=Lolium multiflorum TaxID=4521 RepID=A0AAD8RM74_LOLMU|nr:hypothetical protein QYE76_002265 [Lolium multiflorum]